MELKNICNFNFLKIAVARTVYVGLSLATLLFQHHKVKIYFCCLKSENLKPTINKNSCRC